MSVNYEEIILNKLNQVKDHMSMCEIFDAVEKAGGEIHGDISMEHPKFENIFMWVGVSRGIYEALNSLLSKKVIHYVPAELLTYAIGGRLLDMPIVRDLPKDGFKEPHWIPVVFRPGPAPKYHD